MNIPTIRQIIIRITTTIALVELFIMVVLVNTTFDLGPYQEAFLDVAILTILSTPIIFFWIIKPYVVAHSEVINQINHMAYHDPLTQLPNRRLLLEFLEMKMASLSRYKLYGALMFIDLDGFKIINDDNGHDAGDTVLVNIAMRLKASLRAEDIASRVGGDEFVIVLGHFDTDRQQAYNKALIIAGRIQKELSKAIEFESETLHIGSSIGLRLLSPDDADVDIALKDADTAMYSAKQAGRGRIVVFSK